MTLDTQSPQSTSQLDSSKIHTSCQQDMPSHTNHYPSSRRRKSCVAKRMNRGYRVEDFTKYYQVSIQIPEEHQEETLDALVNVEGEGRVLRVKVLMRDNGSAIFSSTFLIGDHVRTDTISLLLKDNGILEVLVPKMTEESWEELQEASKSSTRTIGGRLGKLFRRQVMPMSRSRQFPVSR